MREMLLIVDDEKNTRDGLCQALESIYDIHLARDTNEALQLLSKERFDVVLTDLRMAKKWPSLYRNRENVIFFP